MDSTNHTTPNYDITIIVPSFIRSDKRFDYFDKLLYSLLYGFYYAGKEIFASNAYLAKILDCTEKHIQSRLKKYEDMEYIHRHYKYKNGIKRRYIDVLYPKPQPVDNTDELVPLWSPTGVVGVTYRCSGGSPTGALDVLVNNKDTNKEKIKTLVQADARTTEMFNLFWDAYLRKQSRQSAWKAFCKCQGGHAPDEVLFKTIMDHIYMRNANEWFEKDKKFIPLAATFLNGKRWTDEIMSAQVTKTKKPQINFRAKNIHDGKTYDNDEEN